MKGPEADDFVAEINMTPFVDIVLVLLIIFMVSAPLLESRLDVQLPVSQSKTDVPPPNAFEVCIIHKSGKIEFLNKHFASFEKFEGFLKKEKLASQTPIFIRADEQITYGVVSQVLGLLKVKGVQNVSLVTRDQ